jgi:hypothetical protein
VRPSNTRSRETRPPARAQKLQKGDSADAEGPAVWRALLALVRWSRLGAGDIALELLVQERAGAVAAILPVAE